MTVGAAIPGAFVPDRPVVVIKPGGGLAGLDLRQLWRHRELLYFLAWRDVKIRYKQTALGVAWVVLQPLFAMLVFTLLFGRLAGMPSEGIPYPIFAFSGLLPWTFFSNAVTNSGNSLVLNQSLLTKIYFPRILIPTAAVSAGLLDFGIAGLILACLMAWYGIAPGPQLLMLPLLALITCLLALGVGTGLAALNVKYRDVRHALPFVMQMWMFLSPVIYPPAIVPERWRWLLAINPLTGVIDGFRSALFGRPFDSFSLGMSLLLAISCVVAGSLYFRRMERVFADIA
jgi:lipopolysaccharide transport system permease protein